MSQVPQDRQPSPAAQPAGSEILRAQLAIEPHPDSNCAVVECGTDVESLTQDLKRSRACFEEPRDDDCTMESCGECHAEVTLGGAAGKSRQYLKSSVHEKCICPVFEEHDCIPDIRDVRSGAVVTVVTVRDRTSLKELLAELRTVGASVSVDWLVRGQEAEATMEISVDEITTKQEEALEIALEGGYYDTPRKTDLGELAAELSISESAVSQRLNAAETKLVRSFLEE